MTVRYRVLIPLLLGLTAVWAVFVAPNQVKSYLERTERDQRPDVMLRSRALEEEVTDRLHRIQVSDWIDEFSQKAVDAHASGQALYMEQAPFEEPADLSVLGERLERGLRDGTPGDIAVAVVGVNRGDFEDPFPTYSPTMVMSNLAIAGVRDGQEFCLTIITDEPHPDSGVGRGLGFRLTRWDSNADADANFQHGVLAQCYWIAQYGLPGPLVRDWLERGGMSLGGSPNPGGAAILRAEYMTEMERLGTLARLAMGTLERPLENEAGRRCRYDRSQCDFIWRFDENPVPTDGYLDGLAYIGGNAHFYGDNFMANPYIDEFTFSALAEEFGPQAFGEFWTSDATPIEAFSAAFGISPLDWSHERVVGILGEVNPGPTPTKASVMYGVLMGLLGLLTSVLFGLRRQTA